MKNHFLTRASPFILLLFLVSAAVMPASVSAEVVKGTISVISSPQGADIYLNDENIGRQTNYVILDVFPGIHYIRLEMAGYKTWEQIIEVKEGEITYVSHEMEPFVGDAFTISTKPEGARIYIDGEFEGFSNTVLNELPAGQHTVLLTLDNYSDYSKTVRISEDMSQSLTHTFEPMPTTGEIVFESDPSNAGVYLNGENVGNTRKTLAEVEPGTYDVVIKKTGYDDWKGIVDVAAGKISEVKATLSLSKVSLSVETDPQGADVYLDGELLGESPLAMTAEQGSHTVTVEKFGYKTVEETVQIGVDGASFSYTLVSMAPEAIAEAEAVVSENLVFSPAKAQEILDKAKDSLSAGDSESAINYARSAIDAALDVDEDGVINSQDMSPNINNMVIYLAPVLIFILIAGLFVKDFAGHRIRPEIVLDIPKVIKEDDMLARGHVTADAVGGPYRAFVCTIYIDGVSVDHFTDPGRYDVMLSARSPGEHSLLAHLQVAKKRYGSVEIKAGETFTVKAAEHKEPVEPEAASGSVIDLGAESKSVIALGPAGSSDNAKKAEGIIDTDEYSEELEDYYEKDDDK